MSPVGVLDRAEPPELGVPAGVASRLSPARSGGRQLGRYLTAGRAVERLPRPTTLHFHRIFLINLAFCRRR